ncbi:MAG: phospholipase D-like domain-containing protein, partial [Candidatus Nitrosocaldus sp.]
FTLKGSDFFNIVDEPSLRLQQFSISAWFRTSSTFTNHAMIVNKGGFDTSTSRLNYGLWITTNGTLRGGFEESDGTNRFVTSPNTYNDGQWHYAVVTYDGSTLRLYVDGQQVSSLNTNGAAPATDTMPLTIGKNSSTNSRYFIGDIDEVRIYNRALTAQEVNDAYNNGVFASNGLLIYLDMNHELLLSGVTNMEDLYYSNLLTEINNATRKIHVVTFWMEYKISAGSNYRPNVILDAINNAKNRGVDVRLMYYYESENVWPDLKPFLINNSIPHKTVSTHAKIINIDDKFVYIGSGNINNNGLRHNHEIFIKSYNLNIIDRATKYLDRLWTSGSREFVDNGYDNILVSNGYYDSVLNALQNAKDKIRIIMFNTEGYRNDPSHMPTQLLAALNDAKNRGVDVKVIVDGDWDGNGDGIPDNSGAISYLKSRGIPIKSDEGEPPRTHVKMVIVDDTTYIGSHNWTQNQLASTNESSVKLKSPFILQKVIEYFDWKWSRGRIL